MLARGVRSVGMSASTTGFAFVILCGMAGACSGSKDTLTARDAASESREVHDDWSDVARPDVARPDAANADAGVQCDPAIPPVALSDAGASSRSDADPQLPTGLVAPAPPEICCDVTAGSTACDLPPSGCASVAGADAAFVAPSQWIVFYENARCVSGRCVWDQSYFQCLGGSTTCVNGACAFVGTTLP